MNSSKITFNCYHWTVNTQICVNQSLANCHQCSALESGALKILKNNFDIKESHHMCTRMDDSPFMDH